MGRTLDLAPIQRAVLDRFGQMWLVYLVAAGQIGGGAVEQRVAEAGAVAPSLQRGAASALVAKLQDKGHKRDLKIDQILKCKA